MATLHITQQDIDEANKVRDYLSFDIIKQCPVARAANRFYHRDDLNVDYSSCHMYYGLDEQTEQIMFYIPSETVDWISDWDSKLPVVPISFEVELLT